VNYLKSMAAVFVLAVLALAPISAMGQAEHLSTKANTSAVRGTTGMLDEHSHFVRNDVNVSARHCKNYASAEACAADPASLFFTETHHNLRTNAGGDWQASVMGNTSGPPATGNYIALSNDATAPSTSDTTVTSEIATNGLSRAQGVYAHTGGTSSYTIQKVFSATGTQASQKAGLLNAASVGTLVFENTYTQVTVNNGDTLTVTWTINY
jgi:hypothetical protein